MEIFLKENSPTLDQKAYAKAKIEFVLVLQRVNMVIRFKQSMSQVKDC
jgi:hypothetical protein